MEILTFYLRFVYLDALLITLCYALIQIYYPEETPLPFCFTTSKKNIFLLQKSPFTLL